MATSLGTIKERRSTGHVLGALYRGRLSTGYVLGAVLGTSWGHDKGGAGVLGTS